MSIDLREKVHQAVDELPQKQLADVLRMIELLASAPPNTDVEPEEMWLLSSGALKRIVDEIDNAPPPVEDWRSHLHDL